MAVAIPRARRSVGCGRVSRRGRGGEGADRSRHAAARHAPDDGFGDDAFPAASAAAAPGLSGVRLALRARARAVSVEWRNERWAFLRARRTRVFEQLGGAPV